MDRAGAGKRRRQLAEFARFLTDFADQAVILPLCLCAVIGLALAGWRRGAAGFGLAAFAVLALMLALKLLALGCGRFLPWLRIASPSGHTAVAAAIYGGAIALALRRFLSPWPAIILAGLPLALAIGATRLALGVHTLGETIAGGAVGLAGTAGMVFLAGPPPAGLRAWRIVLPILALIALLHGLRLPAEQHIRWAALHVWPFSVCRPIAPIAGRPSRP
jgi:membrane-associated phospholipid phosphatase